MTDIPPEDDIPKPVKPEDTSVPNLSQTHNPEAKASVFMSEADASPDPKNSKPVEGEVVDSAVEDNVSVVESLDLATPQDSSSANIIEGLDDILTVDEGKLKTDQRDDVDLRETEFYHKILSNTMALSHFRPALDDSRERPDLQDIVATEDVRLAMFEMARRVDPETTRYIDLYRNGRGNEVDLVRERLDVLIEGFKKKYPESQIYLVDLSRAPNFAYTLRKLDLESASLWSREDVIVIVDRSQQDLIKSLVGPRCTICEIESVAALQAIVDAKALPGASIDDEPLLQQLEQGLWSPSAASGAAFGHVDVTRLLNEILNNTGSYAEAYAYRQNLSKAAKVDERWKDVFNEYVLGGSAPHIAALFTATYLDALPLSLFEGVFARLCEVFETDPEASDPAKRLNDRLLKDCGMATYSSSGRQRVRLQEAWTSVPGLKTLFETEAPFAKRKGSHAVLNCVGELLPHPDTSEENLEALAALCQTYMREEGMASSETGSAFLFKQLYDWPSPSKQLGRLGKANRRVILLEMGRQAEGDRGFKELIDRMFGALSGTHNAENRAAAGRVANDLCFLCLDARPDQTAYFARSLASLAAKSDALPVCYSALRQRRMAASVWADCAIAFLEMANIDAPKDSKKACFAFYFLEMLVIKAFTGDVSSSVEKSAIHSTLAPVDVLMQTLEPELRQKLRLGLAKVVSGPFGLRALHGGFANERDIVGYLTDVDDKHDMLRKHNRDTYVQHWAILSGFPTDQKQLFAVTLMAMAETQLDLSELGKAAFNGADSLWSLWGYIHAGDTGIPDSIERHVSNSFMSVWCLILRAAHIGAGGKLIPDPAVQACFADKVDRRRLSGDLHTRVRELRLNLAALQAEVRARITRENREDVKAFKARYAVVSAQLLEAAKLVRE